NSSSWVTAAPWATGCSRIRSDPLIRRILAPRDAGRSTTGPATRPCFDRRKSVTRCIEDAGAELRPGIGDEKGGPMSSRDTIAQLNQDITAAEDAGNEAEAARLRRELE